MGGLTVWRKSGWRAGAGSVEPSSNFFDSIRFGHSNARLSREIEGKNRQIEAANT